MTPRFAERIVLIEKMATAPIADSFKVLKVDYADASLALEKNGIVIGNAKTLEDIWVNNNVSPEDVIDTIMK